jgi:hypothetical protein
MYNHHQAGPAGSILAGPPYRDPFNYVFDPLVITSLDAVGAAMVNRLNEEGKPGYTERAGSVYSTWYNGGLRTTTYFHNMIGLLTEIIGGPNPAEVPLVPQRLIPNGATPFPVTPQKWLFRQSIDYSISLNYAVLDYASRYRDELLYNIYKMGRNSIERGSKDYLDTFAPAYRRRSTISILPPLPLAPQAVDLIAHTPIPAASAPIPAAALLPPVHPPQAVKAPLPQTPPPSNPPAAASGKVRR